MLADEARRRTGAPGPAAGTKQTATLALISVAGLLPLSEASAPCARNAGISHFTDRLFCLH